MSFLNETKNFGLILMILGLIEIFVGAYMLVDSLDTKLSIISIGTIIAGVLYVIAGDMIYTQKTGPLASMFEGGIDTKFGVVTGYVYLAGFCITILGLCTTLDGGDGLIIAIFGVIMAIIAWALCNGNKGTVDKILYVVLVILFLLVAITGVWAIIDMPANSDTIALIAEYIRYVMNIVMALVVFIYLLSAEVKEKIF